jgi:hypothetical protein
MNMILILSLLMPAIALLLRLDLQFRGGGRTVAGMMPLLWEGTTVPSSGRGQAAFKRCICSSRHHDYFSIWI